MYPLIPQDTDIAAVTDRDGELDVNMHEGAAFSMTFPLPREKSLPNDYSDRQYLKISEIDSSPPSSPSPPPPPRQIIHTKAGSLAAPVNDGPSDASPMPLPPTVSNVVEDIISGDRALQKARAVKGLQSFNPRVILHRDDDWGLPFNHDKNLLAATASVPVHFEKGGVDALPPFPTRFVSYPQAFCSSLTKISLITVAYSHGSQKYARRAS